MAQRILLVQAHPGQEHEVAQGALAFADDAPRAVALGEAEGDARWGDLPDDADADEARAARRLEVTRTVILPRSGGVRGSPIHPNEFPRSGNRSARFATLRDMIDWCIEKPNEDALWAPAPSG